MERWVSFLWHYGIHTTHTSVHYVLVWPSKSHSMYSETFSGCAPSQVCHFSVFLDCFAPNQDDNQPIKGLIEKSCGERNRIVEEIFSLYHTVTHPGATIIRVMVGLREEACCRDVLLSQRTNLTPALKQTFCNGVTPSLHRGFCQWLKEDSWDRIWVFYLCRWESSFQITHVRCAVGHLSSTWLSSNRLCRLFPYLSWQQLLLITRATMPKAAVKQHRFYIVV